MEVWPKLNPVLKCNIECTLVSVMLLLIPIDDDDVPVTIAYGADNVNGWVWHWIDVSRRNLRIDDSAFPNSHTLRKPHNFITRDLNNTLYGLVTTAVEFDSTISINRRSNTYAHTLNIISCIGKFAANAKNALIVHLLFRCVCIVMCCLYSMGELVYTRTQTFAFIAHTIH